MAISTFGVTLKWGTSADNLSKNGREVALKRHNKKHIVDKLINIYDSIISQNIKNIP